MRRIFTAMVVVTGLLGAIPAFAVPIDLSTFVGSAGVTVASNGSSATFSEALGGGTILDLLNFDVPMPMAGTEFAVSFNYEFAPDENDTFSFYFLDLSWPAFTVPFDSTGAPVALSGKYVGMFTSMQPLTSVAMIFELYPQGLQNQNGGYDDPAVFASSLTIRNVEVNRAAPVPEPGTLGLFGAGLVGLLCARGRKSNGRG